MNCDRGLTHPQFRKNFLPLLVPSPVRSRGSAGEVEVAETEDRSRAEDERCLGRDLREDGKPPVDPAW